MTLHIDEMNKLKRNDLFKEIIKIIGGKESWEELKDCSVERFCEIAAKMFKESKKEYTIKEDLQYVSKIEDIIAKLESSKGHINIGQLNCIHCISTIKDILDLLITTRLDKDSNKLVSCTAIEKLMERIRKN